MPSPNSPNSPYDRQDFLLEQERAIHAAREMQRRATLPVPPKPQQKQFQPPPPPPRFQQPKYQYTPPTPPTPPPPPQRPECIRHPCPGQQARRDASYDRTQPPIRRHSGNERAGPPPPPPKQTAQPNMADIFKLFSGLGGSGGSQNDNNAAKGTPLGDFFADKSEGEGVSEGMDSLLIMVMLLLLRQENADQGLLLALMYIMM